MMGSEKLMTQRVRKMILERKSWFPWGRKRRV